MKRTILALFIFLNILNYTSCEEQAMPPLKPVDYVDLERFMGDWYVVGIIPNFIEKNAVNGIENYQLNAKGQVDITYTFYKSDPQGQRKTMHAKGFIQDERHSEWRVQFIWPLKLPYLVIMLDDDYQYTVIGVPNRKFIWIMSRTPEIEDTQYQNILAQLGEKGYDTAQIKKMPQIWPE